MTAKQTNVPMAFLRDHTSGGVLSTLNPLPAEGMRKVAKGYPGLSSQYLNFIAAIGVGETRTGLYIYEPIAASDLPSLTDFRFYKSKASRRLFGFRPAKQALPKTLLCVADTGSSWRYCLDMTRGDEVLCLDVVGRELTKESDDFFAFIQESLSG